MLFSMLCPEVFVVCIIVRRLYCDVCCSSVCVSCVMMAAVARCRLVQWRDEMVEVGRVQLSHTTLSRNSPSVSTDSPLSYSPVFPRSLSSHCLVFVLSFVLIEFIVVTPSLLGLYLPECRHRHSQNFPGPRRHRSSAQPKVFRTVACRATLKNLHFFLTQY
jgi:hypothetical protein